MYRVVFPTKVFRTPKRYVGIISTCFALPLIFSLPAVAQTSRPLPRSESIPTRDASASKAKSFDVISIRPSAPGRAPSSGLLPDGYQATNLPLWTTIMTAYFARPLWSNDRLRGAPAWITQQEFDIHAKVDQSTQEEFKHLTIAQRSEQLQSMLRELLAERCKLTTHYVQSETPIFLLTLKKDVTALKSNLPPSQSPSGVALPEGGIMIPSQGTLRFFDTPLSSLASFLSHSSSRPIQDGTGLNGRYNFELHRRDDSSMPNDPESATQYDLGTLGFTLRATRAPTNALVIDHIELPTAN